MNVSIIGLGYVGLPLAILCSKKGHDVIGIDTNIDVVDKINKRISPINDSILKREIVNADISSTNDYGKIKDSEVIIVCVPTPVDKKHRPDLRFLISALNSISRYLQEGQLVIIESTINPGTTEEILKPILEKNGLTAGKDFYLSHCPERIDPGNRKWSIENIPRVLGGISKECSKKAAEFYRNILDAEILELKSINAVEATKIMENTFRDVNIAFVNEMAKSFDKAGIDITEVIKGASTKPFAFMPHHPGCGVGGHCIPVDPYYLIEKAESIGFEHKFLALARQINNSMPEYTVELLQDELNTLKRSLNGSKVGILGLAYKKDIDDTREAPPSIIISLLKEKKAKVYVYDPFLLDRSDVGDLDELLDKVDYLVLVTDHSVFRNMDLNKLKENNIRLVVDGRNCLSKESIEKLGIRYKGIGR